MPEKKIDSLILWPALILLLLGFLILFSLSAALAKKTCGNTYCFILHQAVYGLFPGLVLGFFAFKVDLKLLKKSALILFLASLVLMSAVFIPQIGIERGGARRWLRLGSFSFQPSELLKITLPLYLASWLCQDRGWAKAILKNKRGRKNESLVILGCFFLILLPVVLIMMAQKDLGTLIIILFIAFLVYFLAETPFWHSALILLLGITAIFLLIIIAPYRMDRFLIFLNPGADSLGRGYQLEQSLIAVGSGGIFGRGLGMSRQKSGILPNYLSDAAFSVFCEETGLLGAGVLITIFLVLAGQGLKIAKQNRDLFLSLLAAGFSVNIGLQAFLNFGVLIGLLPLTGVPLPFISYGGTHLVVELIQVGILLNISKN